LPNLFSGDSRDKENGIEFTVDGNSFFRGTAFLPGKPISAYKVPIELWMV